MLLRLYSKSITTIRKFCKGLFSQMQNRNLHNAKQSQPAALRIADSLRMDSGIDKKDEKTNFKTFMLSKTEVKYHMGKKHAYGRRLAAGQSG